MPIPTPTGDGILYPVPQQPEPGTSFRYAAASIGLILIGVGALMAGYIFYQVYRIVMDPRPLVEQVNRWEFVIRGRANDIAVRPIERAEAAKARANTSPGSDDPNSEADPLTPGGQRAGNSRELEAAAQFASRIGSLSARPAALLLMIVLLGVLVRIAISFIDTGARLVNLAAGEKEFMQRLLKEITRRQ